jgi:hypothetical protein
MSLKKTKEKGGKPKLRYPTQRIVKETIKYELPWKDKDGKPLYQDVVFTKKEPDDVTLLLRRMEINAGRHFLKDLNSLDIDKKTFWNTQNRLRITLLKGMVSLKPQALQYQGLRICVGGVLAVNLFATKKLLHTM